MSERPPAGRSEEDSLDIAVVGMAARFPGARDVEQYWHNIRAGICSATRFTPEELLERGVDAAVLGDPDFVPVGYVFEDSEKFDAEFFNCAPREAELMDPQHRVVLECAWTALENAGHDPGRFDGLIGVYAGAGYNTYLTHNVATQPDAAETMADKQTVIGNRSDFISSRISYKLGLTGPSVTVQSACSTSLVAVVEACQALLAYQCDMALAGGVSVDGSRRAGYVYRADGIFSPDGYCRTFDSRARGTVGGDGVGMVVLKRLVDAVADRDHIHAVIKGSAVNNDGAQRAGFSAPSAAAQASVISAALANADVPAASIGYVEAHGSATALGDPIEFSALVSAFADAPAGGCAVGSVKTNVGHLDSAAGVAGLIKTVLAVEHGQLPPSLHFEEPNPRLALAGSPFYVNTELRDWPAHGGPRRAGVSSFGLGGTNAHVVLEQAPRPPSPPASDATEQLLVISAKTEAVLDTATERLHDHLRSHPDLNLADVAFTLQHGRETFAFRRTLLCESVQDALGALETRDDGRLLTSVSDAACRPVAFMFTGFGTQFPGMAAELYATEAAFRAVLDRCAEILEPLLSQDIRSLMHDGTTGGQRRATDFGSLLLQPVRGEHPLDQPGLGYPAVFALEYALVQLWASWGVQPDVMIGHSLGEYVAACVAGVFSLPDALRLVVERARLIEAQGEGAMLALPLAEDAAARYTNDQVRVAAVNSPRACVLSGTDDGIDRVATELTEAGVVFRRLNSRFAFHSPMMDPVVGPYTELVRSVRRNRPSRPFVSNVTGTWITDEEAVSPDYWGRHVRQTVRFEQGMGTLWSVPDVVIVEIGPAPTLTTDALQHPAAASVTDRVVVPSLPGAPTNRTDRAALLGAAGRLWLAGVPNPFPPDESGRRVPLPEYPFQRRTYWLRPGTAAPATQQRHASPRQWFYTPSWQRLVGQSVTAPRWTTERWLVFADDSGVGHRLADRLTGLGATVHTVVMGDEWRRKGQDEYMLDPTRAEHFTELADALRSAGTLPERVVHCWGVGDDAEHATTPARVRSLLARAFGSLVRWAQATETDLMTRPQRWDVVTTEVHAVVGDEPLSPPKAAVQGICRVLAQEYPSLTCRHVDLRLDGPRDVPSVVDTLLTSLAQPAAEQTVALRGRHLWAPTYVPGAPPSRAASAVRADGVYLVTGGLGKIGLLVARALAERERVRLVLLGRTGLPPRQEWDSPGHDAGTRSVISAVRAIESMGTEVLIAATDVADRQGMLELKDRVLRRFGPINGVVHCAGTTGPAAHRAVAELADDQMSWHFDPKVHGILVLRDVLAGQRLDFAIICSSVASLLGGLGFAAYAAANAVLDAFAHRWHSPVQPWTSVNWEAWSFSPEDRDRPGIGAAVRRLALSPDEGREVVDILLSAVPQPQIAISTGDLRRRHELWAAPATGQPTAARHARPNLRNPFVAPGTDVERQVAEIWQELLGVANVGVHDNFFELGGSSLLGLQVVHRLRQELNVAVPLTIVYEGPTIRTLGGLIENLRAAP